MDKKLSLAALFTCGRIKKGELITVTLPAKYNANGQKFLVTGTVAAGGKIKYKKELFSTLPDFHQYLKVKRSAELRDMNLEAPKTPGRPTFSAAAKTTTVEGYPLSSFLSGHTDIAKAFEKTAKQECEEISHISIPDDEEDDCEPLPDASMDPFNDYESLPPESISDLEQSESFDENSQNAPSVEHIKSYPPQELVSSDFNPSGDYRMSQSPQESPVDLKVSQNVKNTISDDNLSLDCPWYEKDTLEDSLTTVPQTMDMLSLDLNTLSNSGSSFAVVPLKPSANQQKVVQTLSPKKENLLKAEAKRKLSEAAKNKKTTQIGKKRPRSPGSPNFFPPQKVIKTGEHSNISKNLFPTEKKQIIELSDPLPSPECSESEESPISIQSDPLITKKTTNKSQSTSESQESERVPEFPPKRSPKPKSTSKQPKNNTETIENATNADIKQKKQVLRTSLRSPSPEPEIPEESFLMPASPIRYIKSNDDMSSKDSTPSPQRGSDNPVQTPPVILTSGLTPEMNNKVKMLTKRIGGEMVSKHSDRVSHLITFCEDGIPKTTIKLHQSILSGCWILQYDWILECFRMKKWVLETKYIANGFAGIIAGRKAKLKKENRLFDSFTFCLVGEFNSPTKEEISSIIRVGRGKIVTKLPSPPKTQEEEIARAKFFIICDIDMSNEAATNVYYRCGSHPLSVPFVFECVEQYQVLNTKHYRFIEDEDENSDTVPMSLAF